MTKSICRAFVLAGLTLCFMSGEALAQAGTGPGSGVPGLGGSQPGAVDANKGTETGTIRDPHSGTNVPGPGHSQSSQGIAEQPSGLGEQGSGQTQTTTERSGGQRSGQAEKSAKSSAESGKGKTEQAMKKQSQEQSNR